MSVASVPTYKISQEELNTAIQQLGAFVAIPSVSNPHSSDYNMDHLIAAADFATVGLKELGFDVRQVSIDASAPFIIGASKIVDASKPTLLLYGHYDVQPVDRTKWTSDPFVMQERDGRLYGRGATDDKGGIVGIITALGAYQKAYGALPCNIKVLFEGEEEYLSPNMGKLIEQEKEALAADALVILDGSNVDTNTGTLTSCTRGLASLKLEVRPSAVQSPSKVTLINGSWGKPNGGNSIQESASCTLCAELDHEGVDKLIDSIKNHPVAQHFQVSAESVYEHGTASIQLQVRSMEKPIHSGVGCLAPDPSIALAEILSSIPELGSSPSLAMAKIMASLKEPHDIPGFSSDCEPMDPTERELLRQSSQTPAQYAADHSLVEGAQLRGDPSLSVYERIAEEPSISCINGQMTPELASTEIGVRLTAGQDPERIAALITEYLSSHPATQGFEVTVTKSEGCHAWKGDLSSPIPQAYLEALSENFPNGSHVQPCGGALPLLHEFKRALPNMKMLIPGVEHPKCGAHSDDESQDIALFERAVNSLISFFHKVGKV